MGNPVSWRVLSVLLLGSTLSCGGTPKPVVTGKDGDQQDRAAQKPGPNARQVTTLKLPKGVVIGDSVSLEGFYEDDASAKGSDQGDSSSSNSSSSSDKGERGAVVERAGGPKAGTAVQDVYRRVAPATVIVRSQRGYGTGVIYDPAGWILTNHHVIAHPWHEDFRWKVKVALGKLSPQGVMEKRDKMFDAYVYKIDPLVDLAIIKLVNPPKDLAAVAISPKDPTPGEAVSAIGHAGIGLVWAIKDGQISAVGKLSTHLAQLMLYNSKNEKVAPKDWSAKRRAQLIEAYRKKLQKMKPALVIQSTADISQGDSGGPLVNRQSELVGLNAFVRSGGAARKESNFHIHVREIRKFVKDVPQKVPQLVPDPWKDGGSVAKLGDADSDSRIDVMVLYKMVVRRFFYRQYRQQLPRAYFIDLDQDSFRGVSKLPALDEVLEKRRFDAEFVFLANGPHLHAWYDTNNDGKYDILLVADARTQKMVGAYRIDAAGKLAADAKLMTGKLVRPSLFANSELAQRLEKVGSRFFSYRIMSTSRPTQRYPHPVHSIGHDGSLLDLDRDGVPDAMHGKGLFARGHVFDIDQNSLGSFKTGDSLLKLQGRQIDAEFSLIQERRSQWAWYDTDDDGKFDLLLHSHYQPSQVVSQAWRVGADGKYVPDPTQLGRLMIQPDLLQKHAAKMRKMASRITAGAAIASGKGVGSFVDPKRYIGWRLQIKDIKGWRNVAVAGRYGSCHTIMVDLDRDSGRIAKRKKTTLEKLVRMGQFDAELARVQCYSSVWTFYDTRGKGRYDTVLYSRVGGRGKATVAYAIDKKDNVTIRKKPLKCDGMIIPRLFRNARLRRNLMKVAGDLFGRVPDGSCRP